ncbi:unnamed protein product [Mesocestoides corti]|uniref:DUF5683 domain-containing protein n=1 Tax=Mesocestoides corti TaxID=53468 RepID=A0A0R3U185_MESCO|nr:unnamed protein product [Mesocestoides corti]
MDAAFIWKLSKLGQIGSSRQRYDDDFSDRLNYQYTSVLFFLFIGLIGIRQYVVNRDVNLSNMSSDLLNNAISTVIQANLFRLK